MNSETVELPVARRPLEPLVMRIFPVLSVEWDVEDGDEITIIKVRGTIDAAGAGDVIEYRPANEAMDPQTSEVNSVLALLDDLAGQWGDEAVFRRCRDRLRELVTIEAQA